MIKVRFLRGYDDYAAGQIATFPDGVAEDLCRPAADGEGAYAEKVNNGSGDAGTDEGPSDGE